MIYTNTPEDFESGQTALLIEAIKVCDDDGKIMGYVVAIPNLDYVPYIVDGAKVGPAYVAPEYAFEWVHENYSPS